MHRRVWFGEGGCFFGWYVLFFSLFFFVLFYGYRSLWGVFFGKEPIYKFDMGVGGIREEQRPLCLSLMGPH